MALIRINPHWVLARTPPGGWPVDADFEWHESAASSPGPGQMLTQTVYLSLDPYQWGRRRRGIEAPGEVCHGRTVSRVIESRLAGYQPGDYVFNTNGWQTFGLTGDGITDFGYMYPRRLDPGAAPDSAALVLGMLGLTAWAGLCLQCMPGPGETVVVSAASGGVGQIAGQIARLRGCRVIGIAGREEKCAYVRDTIGLDACISHLSPDLRDELRQACPDGIDVYFENVGGRVFEAVLGHLNQGARITLCGLASQYGAPDQDIFESWKQVGAPVFSARRVRVHPLFVGDYVSTCQDQFLEQMGEWVRAGLIRYREDISAGLETAPRVFQDMLAGRRFGKVLVQVSDDPSRPVPEAHDPALSGL